MNDRERSMLRKLSTFAFCTNETKAVLHMLAGGDFKSVPVPETSRERLVTMLKGKGIVEKVNGRYQFSAEYSGLFAVDAGAAKVLPRAAEPPAAAPEKPPESAAPSPPLPPAPSPPPAPMQAAQVAPSKAIAPAPPPVPPRFLEFSASARAFLCRSSAQQADTCRAWFARGLGEREGQVVLDCVSDLAASVMPRHSANLDQLLGECEKLACKLFN